ncbi:MAG: hypothetical protein R3D67_19825 [Hyphomicrobiaceae bacterium]
MKTLALTAAALAIMTTAAAAESYDARYRNNVGAKIDQRQANQQSRIWQGVRSGQLTPSETRKLQAEQARIRALEHRAKADGYVSRTEARRIASAQRTASRHIEQEKHDAQTRGNPGRRPGLWKRGWW